MIPLGMLLLALACPLPTSRPQATTGGWLPDTLAADSGDSSATIGAARDSTGAPSRTPSGVTVILPDTVRPRRRAVDVSDAYAFRLRIHRYASYTMIPLFVAQSVAGNQLYQADRSGAPRPEWARFTHSAGAAGLGALFTVNTVTGLWNLWDSRGNEVGRTKRWVHTALMLGSDAGFTYAGVKLGGEAKSSQSSRDQHRRISFVSMGAALAGYAVMLVGNH